MCGVVAALTAAAGIMQAKAQKDSANAQADAYNAQAQQADANASLANREKDQVAQQYNQKQKQLDARRDLAAGSAAASAGSSGLSLEGSPLDLLNANQAAWKTDSTNLLQNQRNDTYDLYAQSHNYTQQANQDRAAASNAKSQGDLAAFGTILGTAGSVAGLKNKYKTNW